MRTLLLAVLVLALAAAAWLLLARGGAVDEPGAARLVVPAAAPAVPAVARPVADADAPASVSDPVAPAALVAALPPGERLAPVGVLRGRVVDGRGEPLADASVVLIEGLPGPWTSGDELRLGQETTGADGRFDFARVPANREVGLLVRLGARRRWLPELATDAGTPLDLGDVVLGGPVALRGRVLDERTAPVAGARIFVGDLRAACVAAAQIMARDLVVDIDRLVAEVALAEATSDASGSFTVEGLHPGVAAVLARAPGRADEVQPVLLGPDGAMLDLVLRAGGEVSGRVVSASGKAVAGALVGAGDETWFAHTTTGADGRFELRGLPAEVDDMGVVARGFEPADVGHVEPGMRDLLVTLQPLGGARVTVLGPDGAPAAEAMLRLLPLREGFFEGLLELSEPWSFAGAERGAPGSFVLAALPDRRHIVQAVSRTGLLSPPEWIDPDTPPVQVTLHLAPPRRVSGRLTDAESGEPLAGAEVRGLLGSTLDSAPDAPSFTGADGRFTIDLPAAFGCGLHLSAADHVDAEVPVPIGRDEVVHALRPAGSLRVFVSPETAGAPFAPVSVKLEPRGGGRSRRASYVVESCVFSRLAPGEWDVRVEPETWLEDTPSREARTTVTVIARRQAVVEL